MMSSLAADYRPVEDNTTDEIEVSNETGKDNDRSAESFGLKRNIGFWSGLFVSANIIIGSGIFISPNGVFKAANGSVGISLLIWVFGGCVAALSSLCYGELATSIPESGSNFVYFHLAFGPAVAFLVPWMNVLVPTGDALQLLMFSSYALSPFLPENCFTSPPFAVKLLSIAILFLIVFVNCWSVKVTVRVQSAFVAFKFIAMGLILAGAIMAQIKGSQVAVTNFENAFDEDVIAGITYASMSSAFYQVMWSYDGWTVLTQVSEEVKGARTIVFSVLLTLAIVTISYLLLNTAYLLVLTPDELMKSQLVAATFADKVFGKMYWLAPLTICICTMGGTMASYLTFGRISYVAARRGHFPMILGMLHTERETPIPGLCCNAFFAVILILIGDLTTLMEAFGFIGYTFYSMSAIAVLVLRYKRPELERPFKVPAIVPVLVALISTFFVVSEIVRNLHILYIYAIGFFALGIIVYYVVVEKKLFTCRTDTVNLFLQKLLSVAPAEWNKLE